MLYRELSTADSRIQSRIYHRIFDLTGSTAMKSEFLMASSSKGNIDAMRRDILHQLHAAHLGIEKTRLLMRESVYWPNIYKDIDMMVKCCAVCKESQTEHRQQPLLARSIHTVDQGDHRYVPDQRGQLSACYRLSLQEDALNNQHCNRKQVCTMVQHVWTATRNSEQQRPTVCRTAIRRHVQ